MKKAKLILTPHNHETYFNIDNKWHNKLFYKIID